MEQDLFLRCTVCMVMHQHVIYYVQYLNDGVNQGELIL